MTSPIDLQEAQGDGGKAAAKVSAPCSHGARKRERVRCASLVDWPVYPRSMPVRSVTRSNRLREAGASTTGPRLSDCLSTGLQRLLAGICSVGGLSAPHTCRWRSLQPRDRYERVPDQGVLKQGRDSGRSARQHDADVAELRRRCVESPDLAITGFDLTNKVSNLRNRIGHVLHLFGETVPFGQNALMLRPHTAICFERLQGLDPFGKLRCTLPADGPV